MDPIRSWATEDVKLSAKLSVRAEEPRSSLRIELTNRGEKPYKLSDADFHFTNGDLRVFLPRSMQVGGEVVKPGETRSFSLDWTTVVTEGLWLLRTEPFNGPGLSKGRDKDHEFFRLHVADTAFLPVELKAPATVLREIEEWKKVTVEASLDKQTYFLGEYIELKYQVTNNSASPVKIDWGGDSRAPRQLRFKIIATGKDGRVVDPFTNPYCMGGEGGTSTIEPGASTEFEMWSLALSKYCMFTAPGKYRIQVYHDLGWEREKSWDNLSTNELPKAGHRAPIATTTIELRMPSKVDAENILNRIRASNAKDYNSFADFEGLRSNAYLTPLRKWIDENGGSLGGGANDRTEQIYGLAALVGIGSIETPEATAALIKLLSHRDKRVSAEALNRILQRLPNPTKFHGGFFGGVADRKRRAMNSWKEEFRQPLLQSSLKLLDSELQQGDTSAEKLKATRKSLSIVGQVIQAIALQKDYPELRSRAEKVARKYIGLAEEQSGYPRPVTVTSPFINALWCSFCNGKAEYQSAPQPLGVAFKTLTFTS